MIFGRIFDDARKAQGFLSQAHLDAFFTAYDHMSACADCKSRDGYTLTDDGWQPTSGRCAVGRALETAAHAYYGVRQ